MTNAGNRAQETTKRISTRDGPLFAVTCAHCEGVIALMINQGTAISLVQTRVLPHQIFIVKCKESTGMYFWSKVRADVRVFGARCQKKQELYFSTKMRPEARIF